MPIDLDQYRIATAWQDAFNSAHRNVRENMETPLQIAFRNMERSEAMARKIAERAAKLERSYDGIIACRVSVELQHKHHRSGNHYRVRVDLRSRRGAGRLPRT